MQLHNYNFTDLADKHGQSFRTTTRLQINSSISQFSAYNISTNDGSLSPPVSHLEQGPLLSESNTHIGAPVSTIFKTPTLQRFSPAPISETSYPDSIEKDRLSPSSLNLSMYIYITTSFHSNFSILSI